MQTQVGIELKCIKSKIHQFHNTVAETYNDIIFWGFSLHRNDGMFETCTLNTKKKKKEYDTEIKMLSLVPLPEF